MLKKFRSRTAARLVALLLAATASTSLSVGVAAADTLQPPTAPVQLQLPKKGLLVLLENGGFSTGLPAKATVQVWRCSTFKVPSTDDVWAFIQSAWDTVSSVPSCLDPRNWTLATVNVRDFVKGVSEPVIERTTATAILNSGVQQKYDKVVLLQNGDFNATRVRTELTSFASGGYTVDVHVLSHGATGVITGGGGNISPSQVEGYRTIPGLKLRAVYQMNCFGSSMNTAWRNAGASVVTGATRINYLGLDYASFLVRWLAGQSFSQSVSGSTADWTPFFTTLYHFVDFFAGNEVRSPALIDVWGNLSANDEFSDSAMVIAGSGGVTINSM
jgi:hypothetical protein